MRHVQFNFNNEIDRFELLQNEETGVVQVPGENGEILAEYDSLEQFAEVYAQARDVKPEHLKNWILVENGGVVSFILRAGTAGIDAASIAEHMNAVFQEARANVAFHPLAIMRVEQEIQNAADVMTALAMSTEQEVARFVYDRLNEMGAFVEPVVEEPEVDSRSVMERYLDKVLEQDHTLAFFGNLLHTPVADKQVILEALEHSPIPYTVDMLSTLYEDALYAAKENIGVCDRFTAILVVTQSVPANDATDAKKQMLTAARMAGRGSVNVTYYVVGQHHLRKTAKLLSIPELRESALFLVNNTPILVEFSDTIDEELEAERDAEDERRRAEESDDGYDYEDEDYDDEDDNEPW